MYQNIKNLLSLPQFVKSYICLVIGASLLWWYTTDIENMIGNYGNLHTGIDISLSIILIVGFPLFLIAIFYKIWKYGKRANIEVKTSTGVVGGTLGTIISGASCCGPTLAASFGLLPLMAILPYDGLELKILGTVGLLYALWDILMYLETCKIKEKQNKK